MFVSREIISKCYTRLLHMYSSTYIPKPEEIREKVDACFKLLHKFDEEIFKKACSEWTENEKKMPSPIDLRDKCLNVSKAVDSLINNAYIEPCMFSTMPKPDKGFGVYIRSKYEDYLCCENDFRSKILNGYTLCDYHYTLTRELCGLPTKRVTCLGEYDGDIKWTDAEQIRIEYQLGNIEVLNKLTDRQRNMFLSTENRIGKLLKKGINTSEVYKII